MQKVVSRELALFYPKNRVTLTWWYALNSLVSPMMLRFNAAIAPGLSGSTSVKAINGLKNSKNQFEADFLC